MKSNKDKVSDIKSKTKKCLDDRKSVNGVIDILCYSQEDESPVALAAIRALQQIFARFLSSEEMVVTRMLATGEDLTKEEKLSVWLCEQYSTTCEALVEKLDSCDAKLQEASLVALLKFVELEGKNPLQAPLAGQVSFPYKLLQAVVGKLLSRAENRESLILRLSEVSEHDDVRFFLMKAVKQELGKTSAKDRNELFLCNVLCVLENLEFPESDGSEPLTKLFAVSGDTVSHPKISSLAEQKKSFTSCWMEFLRSELNTGLYRRVLTKLDDKVLPFLSSPLVLADFLTESYNIGGAISLLALNGLFILIHRYNLDYPDFYAKFYSLFEPQVFHVKYRSRFFRLADLFLSSSHLPSYLVASFMKRTARLALSAPSPGARLCMVFIYNLMVRHPSCTVLAHHPDHTLATDPFLMDEADLSKTKALDSSLWEIKTLQSHFSPEVAQEAMKINNPITQEQLLSDFLDDSMEQGNYNSISLLYLLRFDSVKAVASKRPAPMRQSLNTALQKNPTHLAVLQENNINYDHPFTPHHVATLRAERIAREASATQNVNHTQISGERVERRGSPMYMMTERSAKKKPSQSVALNPEVPKGLFDKNMQHFFTLV